MYALKKEGGESMKKVLTAIGCGLSSLALLLVNTASLGLCGEVEPPKCLK